LPREGDVLVFKFWGKLLGVSRLFVLPCHFLGGGGGFHVTANNTQSRTRIPDKFFLDDSC